MGFKYADMLTYIATGAQILAGVLLILGLFTPLAAAGALAYLVNGLLVEAMAAHEEARLSDLPDRRTRVQGHPGRRGRRRSSWPARADTGWTPVAVGPVDRSSAPSPRC